VLLGVASVAGATSSPAAAASAASGLDLDALFVGAHPDDEGFDITAFGQWAENDGLKTGVVTITRGEGGNAVGPEEGPALGLLREGEERRAVAAVFEGAVYSAAGGLPMGTEFSLTVSPYHVLAGTPFTVPAHARWGGAGASPPANVALQPPDGWTWSGSGDLRQLVPRADKAVSFTVTCHGRHTRLPRDLARRRRVADGQRRPHELQQQQPERHRDRDGARRLCGGADVAGLLESPAGGGEKGDLHRHEHGHRARHPRATAASTR
jgi:hypothetical protein